MSNYKQLSLDLSARATDFLKKHCIEKLLKQYGEINYFGSFKLDLMNRPDIDIALVVNSVSMSTVTDLITVLNKKGFNRHWVFDNTDGGSSSDPKHIVYEPIYGFYRDSVPKNERWELGIVITTKKILPEVMKPPQ